MNTSLDFNCDGFCEDIVLAKWLGLSCPTNIRKTIIKHRDELSSYGDLLEMPTTIECSAARYGFWLNLDHVLVLASISRAPRARMVRAEMIRRSTAEPSWAN